MDVRLHQCSERGMDGAVPLQCRQAGEGGADDLDMEMPAAIARAGVADVTMAVVAHFQPAGRKRLLQCIADRRDALFAWQRNAHRFRFHGNTGRNGRTSTRV